MKENLERNIPIYPDDQCIYDGLRRGNCPFCDEPLNENYKFCHICGQELIWY